jgi:hypothetical protein
MKVLSLIVFSVAFLGFPQSTEGWCGLASSARQSPLLSSSSCTTVSNRQLHLNPHRRSASFFRLSAAAKSNSDQKSVNINIEAIKAELTEYLKKRKEMNADDLAKLYVRYFMSCYYCRLLDWVRFDSIAAYKTLSCGPLPLLRPTGCVS